jgi:hypothetical protein
MAGRMRERRCIPCASFRRSPRDCIVDHALRPEPPRTPVNADRRGAKSRRAPRCLNPDASSRRSGATRTAPRLRNVMFCAACCARILAAARKRPSVIVV